MTDVASSDRPRSRTEPIISADDVGWIRALPKAELHLHLSGSLRPATALRLARERGRFPELADDEFTARLRAPDVCRDQAELLEAFAIPVALLQDAEALTVAAAELVEDVASDGTRYVEIRFAPASSTRGGLSLAGVIAAVARGVESGRARVAAPASPPVVRLIAIAMRTDPPARNVEVARAAADARADGMVGFDLAGLEATSPSVEPHLPAFAVAREAGLGISVHAGEWGGASQVREALKAQPQRIAHGAPAARDAALMAELRAREVTLDVCPTSNVQASLVPAMADFPLARLMETGVPVTISTDDRTVSATTLERELALAVDPLGRDRDDLVALTRQAFRAAFLQADESLRSSLIELLDAAVAQRPKGTSA